MMMRLLPSSMPLHVPEFPSDTELATDKRDTAQLLNLYLRMKVGVSRREHREE
jgi:hypothetical protein